MRGGTSRGPYFVRDDLPEDLPTLAQVLIAVVGSGHSHNIDGIGGGKAVTTKVAMLSVSNDEWADIDYFFAQVSVEDQRVDFKPSCGNILTGVAAAAIELGLIPSSADVTQVKIRAVNTNARIIATIQTPDGPSYCGDTVIAGVPGWGSPVELTFMDTVGGATGAFMPTGRSQDVFDDVTVTCMDVAMPMVIAKASSFGLSGYEDVDELDNNVPFMSRMESIRRQAGTAMGLGDVSQSVAPKFGLLAPARQGGSVSIRYFMPWNCHPSMAVTGALCVAACLLTPQTVASDLLCSQPTSPATITLEHPSGSIDVRFEFEHKAGVFNPVSAGLIRTARKLAQGHVFAPARIWPGPPKYP
jgi:2-methylaconitate cis-trans-isomerase PrpF